MSKYRASKACKFSYILLIIVIILAVLLIIIQQQLSQHISEICQYKGRETATEIITAAVKKEIDTDRNDYVNIYRDANGNICSAETNTAVVNILQNRVKEEVNRSLSDIENTEFSVPLGTLSGITLLSGRGADIELGVYQVGSVDTEINSQFMSAGINQTIHKLSIIVTVEISVIMPTDTEKIVVSDELMIAETIIVGKIPDMYLQKVGENIT